MARSNNEFTCSVCKNLYTDPVLHRLCGHSFDRQCIGDICPATVCRQKIKSGDLITNHTLMKVLDERQFRSTERPVLYLILLDTSSSMWFSDSLIPFAIGKSRLEVAKIFLNEFFIKNMNSSESKISLYTFNTDALLRFDFETINQTHLRKLKDLECERKDTALFDAIDTCLETIETSKKKLQDEMPMTYLFVLTDGGNNFGKKESEHAVQIAKKSNKLQILGHVIQIGDRSKGTSRMICDTLKYKFNHFNGGNASEYVNSFTNTIRTRAKTISHGLLNSFSRSQTSLEQSVTSINPLLLNQLPDVPTGPVKIPPKQRVLA